MCAASVKSKFIIITCPNLASRIFCGLRCRCILPNELSRVWFFAPAHFFSYISGSNLHGVIKSRHHLLLLEVTICCSSMICRDVSCAPNRVMHWFRTFIEYSFGRRPSQLHFGATAEFHVAKIKYLRDISIKSDIWSLGPTIWLMTFGKMLSYVASMILDPVIYQCTKVDGEHVLQETCHIIVLLEFGY